MLRTGSVEELMNTYSATIPVAAIGLALAISMQLPRTSQYDAVQQLAAAFGVPSAGIGREPAGASPSGVPGMTGSEIAAAEAYQRSL